MDRFECHLTFDEFVDKEVIKLIGGWDNFKYSEITDWDGSGNKHKFLTSRDDDLMNLLKRSQWIISSLQFQSIKCIRNRIEVAIVDDKY